MAVTIKDLRFSIYLNNADAKKAAIEFQSQLQKIGDSMQDLSNQGKKDTPEYREKKKAFDDLTKAMEANKLQAGLLGMSYKELQKLSKTMKADLNRMIPDSAEWKSLNKDLQAVDNRIVKLKASSSETGGVLSKMATGVNKYFGVVSLALGGVVALGMGFYNAMQRSIEFDKALSNLSALTGATGKDLDYLRDRAIGLAKEYGKSATEIVTAMKLVGSAKPELLKNVEALSDVTKSVLTLSKATGMDLTESTNDVTTIMNQFGVSAIESDKVINILAAGSKYGAKEVDYLGESIAKVGTVSKAAGLTLEQTTAVMELFGEKGIQAEISGNGFKKILVQLQSDTANYTNGVFDLNKAIDNNQKISGDNIELQKKFGIHFFNLAQILFQNKTRFEELTKQVTNTTVAEEQMAIAEDNLAGDMDKMKGSWDAFILSLDNGKGPISNTFRSLVNWTKEALDGLSRLTKNDKQNENADIAKNVEDRINETKKWIAQEKDKIKYINDGITAEREIYKQRQARMVQIQKQVESNNELGGSWKKNNKALNEEYDGLSRSVKESIAYTNALGGLRNSFNQIVKPDANKDGAISETSEEQKKRLDLITQTIDNAHTERLAKLKIAKIKENETDVEYNNKTVIEDKAYYALKIKALTDFQKQVKDKSLNAEITKQINELRNQEAEIDIKFQERISKILLDANPVKKENLEYDDRLRELGLFNKKREEMTVDELQVFELLEKQHQDNLFKIRETANSEDLKQREKSFEDDYKVTREKNNAEIEALSKKAELAKKAGTPFGDFDSIDSDPEIMLTKARIKAIQDEVIARKQSGLDTTKLNGELLQNENKLTDEYVSKFKQRADLFTKFGDQLGTALGDLASGNKDAMKTAIEAMVDLGLDFLKAQVEMSIASATVQSLASPQSILTGGVAGLTQSAILTGLIEAAFTAAKSIINSSISGSSKKGYFTGGYTSGAQNDSTPVGTVHANEFVANAKAVRNPQVRKFLDVFNAAQMNGTIHLLNTPQILEKVRTQTPTGYQQGGYVQTPGGSAGTIPGDVSLAIISENSKQMKRLNDHLDNGIHAINTISGDNGSYKLTQDYLKLKANASR